MASMLSVVPAGHPDLRQLVVGHDPTVRSGTIWALGATWLLNDGGGFSMRDWSWIIWGSWGSTGKPRGRDRAGSQKLGRHNGLQPKKKVVVQLCCRLACPVIDSMVMAPQG